MRKSNRGFNLLELMVALAVAAILLGIGVPSFAEFVRNGRMTSTANDFLSAMYAGRTEAVKRRVPVTVCFSANPTDAEPDCLTGGETATGWFIFADDADPEAVESEDANAVRDTDEVVLVARTFPDVITMTPDSSFAIFQPNGFIRPSGITCTPAPDPADPDICVGGDASLSQVIMCDSRGNTQSGGGDNSAARGLTLTQTGRAEITRSIVRIDALGGC